MNLLTKLFLPSPVYAQNAWSGSCVSGSGNEAVATIQGFGCLFQNIAQVIVYFAGLAFFIMFIKGGFEYLTSSGDPKKTAKATSTLTVAIIGLVGVIASFLILKFIQSFTGANVTDFIIPN
ncbi:MAG: pilin [Candidatus Shapirobacteria bacterium]|nr:pilin [Candidatus Shapirobacteria bacterium]